MKTIKQLEKGCNKVMNERQGSCGDITFSNEIMYCNECQTTLKERNKIIKMVEDKENPYPIDVFGELSPINLVSIHDMLEKKFGFPLDRLSAHIGRFVFNNTKEEILTKLRGEK